MSLVWDAISIAAGLLLTALAVYDAVQTILHPDLDGWLTKRINRWVWRAFTGAGRAVHGARDALVRTPHSDGPERSLRSWAGPAIVILDVALWMVLPIVGYALIVLPAFPEGFSDATREGWSEGERVFTTLYYSAVTFTTLGYGDFAPQEPLLMVWAILAPLTGLLVVGLSIAYVLAVFEGVDARDAIMLRVYAECGVSPRASKPSRDHVFDDGRLDGVHFVVRSYERSPAKLNLSLEAWAADIRSLHGHLYRFHGLAFYLRTRAIRRGPERLMRAFADAAIAARILALRREDGPEDRSLLRDASEHLEDSFVLFAEAMLERGRDRSQMDEARARATLAALIERLRKELGMGAISLSEADEARLVDLSATRMRFLDYVDRLSRGSHAPAPREGVVSTGDVEGSVGPGPVG